MNAQRPDFSRVSSQELTSSISSLVSKERRSLVDLIWRLDELDQRGELGHHKSLFDYCNRKLRLSNGCSYLRWRSVLLFRKFPTIADYLADGRVSFRKAVLLEDVFTTENLVSLLDQATELSEYGVKKLVAKAIPQPAVPDKRRRLRSVTSPGEVNQAVVPGDLCSPAPTSGSVMVAASAAESELAAPSPELQISSAATPLATAVVADGAVDPSVTSSTSEIRRAAPLDLQLFTTRPEKRRRDVRKPLNATDTEFAFTCDDEFLAQFDQAKSLLSHKFPRGGHAEVLGECLRIAIEVILKKKLGTGQMRSASSNDSTTGATKLGAKSSEIGANSSTTVATSDTDPTVTSPGEVTTSTSPGEVTSSVTRTAASPSAPHFDSSAELSTLNAADFTSPGEVIDDFTAPPVPPDLFTRPSRYIPKRLMRTIWERDGGCCSVVMEDGTRCGSTYQVEVDHVEPYALGGPASEANLRLACGPHNRRRAEQFFGSAYRST